jgi:hypothetical protein
MANFRSDCGLNGGYIRRQNAFAGNRAEGRPLAFSADPAGWLALDISPVRKHHSYEAVAKLESLVAAETRRLALPGAVVLRSRDDRHVAAILALPGGHRTFGSLQRTWDFGGNLTLCLVTTAAGKVEMDPGSHTIVSLEKSDVSATRAETILPLAAKARGFVGAAVLGAEDGKRAYLLYRFAYRVDLDEFRADAPVRAALGAPALARYQIVKTYATDGTG